MMTRLGDERGQVIAIVAVGLSVLLGCGALAVDFGVYYHERSQSQSNADAAVLAGARDLPAVSSNLTPAVAQTKATSFYNSNLSSNFDSRRTSAPAPTFPAPVGVGCTTYNCLAIDAKTTLSPLFGKALSSSLGTYYVQAHAQAYVGPPGFLKNVVPVGIPPWAACQAPLCTLPSPTTTLNFDTSADDWALLDLTHISTTGPIPGGSMRAAELMEWIRTGFPDALPANAWYAGNNGVKNGLKQGFDDAIGDVLLIPVFDSHNTTAPNDSYHVIGFSAFIIDPGGVTWNNGGGGNHRLQGHFVKYIATGIPAGPGSGIDFGVFVVGING